MIDSLQDELSRSYERQSVQCENGAPRAELVSSAGRSRHFQMNQKCQKVFLAQNSLL